MIYVILCNQSKKFEDFIKLHKNQACMLYFCISHCWRFSTSLEYAHCFQRWYLLYIKEVSAILIHNYFWPNVWLNFYLFFLLIAVLFFFFFWFVWAGEVGFGGVNQVFLDTSQSGSVTTRGKKLHQNHFHLLSGLYVLSLSAFSSKDLSYMCNYPELNRITSFRRGHHKIYYYQLNERIYTLYNSLHLLAFNMLDIQTVYKFRYIHYL